jgi:hypothetical protein
VLSAEVRCVGRGSIVVHLDTNIGSNLPVSAKPRLMPP